VKIASGLVIWKLLSVQCFSAVVSEIGDSDFVFLPFTDADDFTPLPPVLAKDEAKVKSQWDDEDVEEEPKEEEKPKPVRN